MGFWSAEYRLPRDLARFEPVTIFFQHRFKMVWEVWGGKGGRFGSEKLLCWTQTCPSVICKSFLTGHGLVRQRVSAKNTSCFKHVHHAAWQTCLCTSLWLELLVSYSYNTTGQAPSQRSQGVRLQQTSTRSTRSVSMATRNSRVSWHQAWGPRLLKSSLARVCSWRLGFEITKQQTCLACWSTLKVEARAQYTRSAQSPFLTSAENRWWGARWPIHQNFMLDACYAGGQPRW